MDTIVGDYPVHAVRYSIVSGKIDRWLSEDLDFEPNEYILATVNLPTISINIARSLPSPPVPGPSLDTYLLSFHLYCSSPQRLQVPYSTSFSSSQGSASYVPADQGIIRFDKVTTLPKHQWFLVYRSGCNGVSQMPRYRTGDTDDQTELTSESGDVGNEEPTIRVSRAQCKPLLKDNIS